MPEKPNVGDYIPDRHTIRYKLSQFFRRIFRRKRLLPPFEPYDLQEHLAAKGRVDSIRVPGMVEMHLIDEEFHFPTLDATEVLRIERKDGKLVVTISKELGEAAEEFWKILEDVATKYQGTVRRTNKT